LDLVEAALAEHLAKPNRGGDAAPDRPATNSPTGSQLRSRTFKVDVPTLLQNLAQITAQPATNLSSASEELAQLFPAAGWNKGPGEAYFLSERNGVLFVRAAETNLDLIEALVETLNATPPQVEVRVKFVEVSQSDAKALGFDWYLGNVTSAPSNSPISGLTSGIRGAAPGVFPGNGQTASPTPRELRGDELDWAGRGATNAGSIRVNAMLGSQMTGILTDAQSRVVMKALEQRSGTEVLSAPSVTTLSGRQAQIQVVEMKTVVTGIDPVAGTNTVTTAVIPCGPVLDVVPTVLADGVTVQVNVKASVTEFLGYDPAARGSASGPQPLFRLRELKTIANVWDGQTLILGGGMVELPSASTNAATAGKVVRKQLLVFVTPTIVDPAGNRVHTHDEMPFSTNAVPFQPKPGK
jgi:general secretion pathway protein D